MIQVYFYESPKEKVKGGRRVTKRWSNVPIEQKQPNLVKDVVTKVYSGVIAVSERKQKKIQERRYIQENIPS